MKLVGTPETNAFRAASKLNDATDKFFEASQRSVARNAALTHQIVSLESQIAYLKGELDIAREAVHNSELAAGYNADVADLALHDWSGKLTREEAAQIAKDALATLILNHCGCLPLDGLDYAHIDDAFKAKE